MPTNVKQLVDSANVALVSDEATRLSLDAENGDVAFQQDRQTAFILTGSDPSVDSNWDTLGIGSVDNAEFSGDAFTFDRTVESGKDYTMKNGGSVVVAGPFEVNGSVTVEGDSVIKVI